ncbi:MAG: four helix bundle protein [Planctomycetia bacterium]|nr:four helix bundle protein [Planctomycetia bacterium]MCF6152146.1 four helix bundle protein [Candidatus Kuenenia stuttgartiensis]
MPPQRGQSSDNLPTTISGKSYRDLEVWQSSMDLAVECYNLTKEIPQGKNDALAGQLQRTAASIPATIAKGQAMQNPKEFFNHLSIANGSIAELETYLQVAERLDYIDSDSIKQIKQKAETIAASISRLQKPFADKTQH